MELHRIDSDEYQQKRYEISKEMLAAIYNRMSIEDLIEAKQRDSIIFNCIQIADMLLGDLGYAPQSQVQTSTQTPARSGSGEKSVHKLADLLKNTKDDDE